MDRGARKALGEVGQDPDKGRPAGGLTAFQRLLTLCAGRTWQLLNLSALGGEAGIAQGTARAWLSVLKASYLVHPLPS